MAKQSWRGDQFAEATFRVAKPKSFDAVRILDLSKKFIAGAVALSPPAIYGSVNPHAVRGVRPRAKMCSLRIGHIHATSSGEIGGALF